MSLILMIFYWTIPGLVFVGVLALWRRADTWIAKAVVIGGGGSILLGLLWLGAGRTMYYDAKVRELCAKDGGVKVYETVRLPADKFNQWGQVNFYKPTQGENALGAEYVFKEETHYYRKGNPTFIRHHYKIVRRSDNKLLGETVSYGRGGGDLPGPWHPSSFTCPDVLLAGPNALMKTVFVQSLSKE